MGSAVAKATWYPSALSFLLTGTSLPGHRRRVATALPRTIPIGNPCLNLRSEHRWYFRTSSNQATLPHYGISHKMCATSTSSTKRGAGLPNPEAAAVPALVSVFECEVTSLGCVITRFLWVCAAFRQAILSRLNKPDFTVRNQKLQLLIPKEYSQFGSVSSHSHWQALPYVLGCAFHGWAFHGRAFIPVPGVVDSGPVCHQTETPHASRVERTHPLESE